MLEPSPQAPPMGSPRTDLASARILEVDNFPSYEFREGDFWLGRTPQQGFPVGYKDDTHITIVAGNRSGKGTSCIVPNLCLWQGSIVVVDPKGENATITAMRRGEGSYYCDGMGQEVVVLDPFGATHGLPDEIKGKFNPLDRLSADSKTLISDAGLITRAIVIKDKENSNSFWDGTTEGLIRGLLVYISTSEDFSEQERNLTTLRRLITCGATPILEDGQTLDPSDAHDFLFDKMAQSNHAIVQGVGITFSAMAKETLSGVLTEAFRQTEFLDNPEIQQCSSHSTFDLHTLKTSEKGMSLYITLPSSEYDGNHRWIRMITDLILVEMERISDLPANGHQVLMLFDEFAGLEKMKRIEKGVAQIAGFGVKMCFILQSLPQLKSVYGDNWETFLSNSGLKLFFGNEDHFTLDYASKLVGDTQVIQQTLSGTKTKGGSHSVASGTSTTTSIGNTVTASSGTSVQSGVSEGLSASKGGGRSVGWGESVSATYGKSLPLYKPENISQSKNINTGFNDNWSTGTNSSRNHGSGYTEGISRANTYTEAKGETITNTETATGSESFTISQNIHKTALLSPSEIRILFGKEYLLAIAKGEHPIIVKKSHYYKDPFFTALYDPHPHHPYPLGKIQEETLFAPSEDILNSLFEGSVCVSYYRLDGGYGSNVNCMLKNNRFVCLSGRIYSDVLKTLKKNEMHQKRYSEDKGTEDADILMLAPKSLLSFKALVSKDKPIKPLQKIAIYTYNRRTAYLEQIVPYEDIPSRIYNRTVEQRIQRTRDKEKQDREKAARQKERLEAEWLKRQTIQEQKQPTREVQKAPSEGLSTLVTVGLLALVFVFYCLKACWEEYSKEHAEPKKNEQKQQVSVQNVEVKPPPIQPPPAKKTYSPSFSCSDIESLNLTRQTICYNQRLSELDATLQGIYEQTLEQVRYSGDIGDESKLKKNHLLWLYKRDNLGGDAKNIYRYTSDRINFLNRIGHPAEDTPTPSPEGYNPAPIISEPVGQD